MYSQLYANPAVEAVIWWDFTDGNWLNAPSGMLRRNLSEKPAYKKLCDLINNEWGFPEREVIPDSRGYIHIFGPEGTYVLKINNREEIIFLDRKCSSD